MTISQQFVRFICVGVISTVVNYAVFYVLFNGGCLPYLLANAIGFLSGTLVGFQLNMSWTFGYSATVKRYFVWYLGVYIASLILSLILVKTLVDCAGLTPEVATVIGICVTTCTNFIGIKWGVLKR